MMSFVLTVSPGIGDAKVDPISSDSMSCFTQG